MDEFRNEQNRNFNESRALIERLESRVRHHGTKTQKTVMVYIFWQRFFFFADMILQFHALFVPQIIYNELFRVFQQIGKAPRDGFGFNLSFHVWTLYSDPLFAFMVKKIFMGLIVLALLVVAAIEFYALKYFLCTSVT